jgi:hypothetical protein
VPKCPGGTFDVEQAAARESPSRPVLATDSTNEVSDIAQGVLLLQGDDARIDSGEPARSDHVERASIV